MIITALDPNNQLVSVLMDEYGKIVTDNTPLPINTYPADAWRVDADGNLEISE